MDDKGILKLEIKDLEKILRGIYESKDGGIKREIEFEKKMNKETLGKEYTISNQIDDEKKILEGYKSDIEKIGEIEHNLETLKRVGEEIFDICDLKYKIGDTNNKKCQNIIKKELNRLIREKAKLENKILNLKINQMPTKYRYDEKGEMLKEIPKFTQHGSLRGVDYIDSKTLNTLEHVAFEYEDNELQNKVVFELFEPYEKNKNKASNEMQKEDKYSENLEVIRKFLKLEIPEEIIEKATSEELKNIQKYRNIAEKRISTIEKLKDMNKDRGENLQITEMNEKLIDEIKKKSISNAVKEKIENELRKEVNVVTKKAQKQTEKINKKELQGGVYKYVNNMQYYKNMFYMHEGKETIANSELDMQKKNIDIEINEKEEELNKLKELYGKEDLEIKEAEKQLEELEKKRERLEKEKTVANKRKYLGMFRQEIEETVRSSKNNVRLMLPQAKVEVESEVKQESSKKTDSFRKQLYVNSQEIANNLYEEQTQNVIESKENNKTEEDIEQE